jgi:zinc transporter 9
MFGVALLFAVLTLIVGLLGALLPSSLNLASHQPRLRAATAVAAGLLLASALLVVIPEGFHTASGGHGHGSGEDFAGPVALVMLEYNDGAITSGTAMSEIRSIVHGDGHGEHSDHEHGDEATFEDRLKHVIAQYDGGKVNATMAIADIRALLDDVDHHHHVDEDKEVSAVVMGGALTLGFVSMLLFQTFAPGHAHHGHGHAHGTGSNRSAVIGLTIHAATDGLAIGAAAATGDLAAGLLIVFAVVIHKFPEAFTLGVFSLNDHADERKVFRDVGIFAASTPVMIVLAYFLLSGLPSEWIGLVMLFAGGTLLAVAALDTLPDVHDAETGSTDLLLVLAGVGGMVVLLLVAQVLGIGHAH